MQNSMLILTLDYELYGDGSGDIYKHIVEPTERILSICNKHNVKITIFVECLEILKMKELNKNNELKQATASIGDIERQLQSACKMGHDVQLHLHPQWVDAKFSNESGWTLNEKYYSVCNLIEGIGEERTKEIVGNCKKYLEELLQQVDSSYKCNAFRAGGYCITPSEKIVKILTELDFKIDSSVLPGDCKGGPHGYDFTNSPKEYYWYIENYNVIMKSQNETGMIELPLATKRMVRLFKYDVKRILVNMRQKKHAIRRITANTSSNSILKKILYFASYEYVNWDYCLFTIAKMKKYYNMYATDAIAVGQRPIVLVGHSKEFVYDKSLKKLFQLGKDGNSRFLTVNQFLAEESANQIR